MRPAFRLLVLLLLPGAACDRGPTVQHHEFKAMGTAVALELRDADVASDSLAFAALRTRLGEVQACLSAWDPASELSRLNRAPADSALSVSPLLGDCLAQALALRAASGGAFEPGAGPLMRLWGFTARQGRLPDPDSLAALLPRLGAYDYEPSTRRFRKREGAVSLDLGGIAKGYALDLAAADLRALGLASALVNLGGNLYCLGEGQPGRPWRVGIRDPLDRDRFFAQLLLRDEAVATSGSYERFVTIAGRRYGHVMNPATGRPAEGLLSATTICDRAALGDGLSTALFVLGPESGRALLKEHYPEVAAVLVLPAGGDSLRIQASAALKGRLEILPEQAGRCSLEYF